MGSTSIWELESFYGKKEVIIAGSGMSGLWSAYYLKKLNPSLDILILEKNTAPAGASTRNAGFACFGSVTELMEDARVMGENEMLELVSMRFEGLRRIQNLVADKIIALERFGGYELITSKQYATKKLLQQDVEWLNHCLKRKIGQKEIFRLADYKISRFNFQQTSHLIENNLEAQLDPGKLTLALLRKVQAMGVMLFTGVELTSYESKGSTVTVNTNNGFQLITSKLLITTNGFAGNLIPETMVIPARGQVLVTTPITHLSFKGSFHYDEGFYYFRNLGNRVLVGGARNIAFEEEQTDNLDVSAKIQEELERFLKEVVLPGQAFEIDHRWSGIMGMGSSKFPVIREIQPNCFCAVAMGGMGVALAPVAGIQVAKMMTN